MSEVYCTYEHMQQAFLEPGTQSPRVCSALTSQVCPVGYYCQYASSGVIQCCGLQGGVLHWLYACVC